MDKALEAIGPIAKGIAASMEKSNAKVAEMGKTMIPQWMTTERIIQYIGENNVTPEVFDFDPTSMIPSHAPDEYVNGLLDGTFAGAKKGVWPWGRRSAARGRKSWPSLPLPVFLWPSPSIAPRRTKQNSSRKPWPEAFSMNSRHG